MNNVQHLFGLRLGMKAGMMLPIGGTREINRQERHDAEQTNNLLGVRQEAVATSNQNTKVFTGTRENFALRGLRKKTQINTLFYSTGAK